MRRHSLQSGNIQLSHQQPTYLDSLPKRQALVHLMKYGVLELSYSHSMKTSVAVPGLCFKFD